MVYLGEVADPEEIALIRTRCAAAEAPASESFGRALDEAVESFRNGPARGQARAERLDRIRSEAGRIHQEIGALRRSLDLSDRDAEAPRRAPSVAGSSEAAGIAPRLLPCPELSCQEA
jgi:hypothetical protein